MATLSAVESFVGRLSKDETKTVTKRLANGKTREVIEIVKPGRSVKVVQGQLFEDNHPVVLAFPTMFGKVTNERIEQATAAPGEKRGR